MDAEQRSKVCQLIESVISADGVVVPEEREFLTRVAERFRLADDGLGGGPTSIGHATTALRELDADVRLRVMALLVEAAIVDGKVEPQERALLLASAATLGVEATALEERIARRIKSAVPGL